MPNETDTTLDLPGCIETLQKLELLGQGVNPDPAVSEAGESPETALINALPKEVLYHLGSRIRSRLRLVAPVRRAKCTSCNLGMPRSDQLDVMAGKKPVFCHHCNVLLFADEAERAFLRQRQPR